MAVKEKVPCPRCDAKGVIQQYFYNRKGICFQCWGAKYIYIKVQDGESKEEILKRLRAEHVEDMKRKPAKVQLPDKDNHKNPAYFKGTKTRLGVDETAGTTEGTKDGKYTLSKAEEEKLLNQLRDKNIYSLKGMKSEYKLWQAKHENGTLKREPQELAIIEFVNKNIDGLIDELDAKLNDLKARGVEHDISKVTLGAGNGDKPSEEATATYTLSDSEKAEIIKSLRDKQTYDQLKILAEKAESDVERGRPSRVPTEWNEEIKAKFLARGKFYSEAAKKLVKEIEAQRPEESRNMILTKSLGQSKFDEPYVKINRGDKVTFYHSTVNGEHVYHTGTISGISVAQRKVKVKRDPVAGENRSTYDDVWVDVRGMQHYEGDPVEEGEDEAALFEEIEDFIESGYLEDAEDVAGMLKRLKAHKPTDQDQYDEFLEELESHYFDAEMSEFMFRQVRDEKDLNKIGGYLDAFKKKKIELPEYRKFMDDKATSYANTMTKFRMDDELKAKGIMDKDGKFTEKAKTDGATALKELLAKGKENPLVAQYAKELAKGMPKPDKLKKPEKTEVGQTDRFIVNQLQHTKTGETFFTVEPKERVSMDEFKKMNDELKELGGFYDRFLKRMRFNENPIEKLRELDAPKQSEYASKEDIKKAIEKVEKAINAKTYSMTKITRSMKELQELNLEPDSRDSDSRNKAIERLNNIVMAGVHDVIGRELEGVNTQADADKLTKKWASEEYLNQTDENFVTDVVKDGIIRRANQIASKMRLRHGLASIGALSSTMEAALMQKRLNDYLVALEDAGEMFDEERKVIKQQVTQALESFNNRNKLKEKQKAEVSKEVSEYEQAQEQRKQRKPIAFKDTALGKKVKAIVGDGANTDTQAIEVGKLVSKELEARSTVDRSEMNKVQAEHRKVGNEFNALYDEYKKSRDADARNNMLAELRKIQARREELAKKEADLVNGIHADAKKAFSSVMSDIRNMGGTVNVTDGSTKTIVKRFDKIGVASVFPSDWVENSNLTPINIVQAKKAKGFYRASASVEKPPRRNLRGEIEQNYANINLHSKAEHVGDSVFVHEYAHRLEDTNPHVMELQKQFFERKTEGQSLKRLRDHFKNSNYRTTEVFRPSNNENGWLHAYMGKEYKRADGSYYGFELLTMGMESILWNNNGDLKEHDEEMYHFLLGMIAGA